MRDDTTPPPDGEGKKDPGATKLVPQAPFGGDAAVHYIDDEPVRNGRRHRPLEWSEW